MIKIATLAAIPVFLASYYSDDDNARPGSSSPLWNYERTATEERDSQLLTALEQQDANREATERADQAFLASAEAQIPEGEIPVRRAIAVVRPVVVDPVAAAMAEGYEVRRAIPVERPASLTTVADRRTALDQPFVTMIQEQPAPSRIASTEKRRSSITIFGNQVVVRNQQLQ